MQERKPQRRRPTEPAGGVPRSESPTFGEVAARYLVTRRQILAGGLGAFGASLVGCTDKPDEVEPPGDMASAPPDMSNAPLLGFTAIPISTEDTVKVPPGYEASVLYAWGDPISNGPAFKQDASNTAADQEQQAGMHHDGMRFFPLPMGSTTLDRGLLVMNHEYIDEGLLFPDGMKTWSAEKVRKAQAAHGVSVIEIMRTGMDGRWSVVRPSANARRVTAYTPARISGPAAGTPAMKTTADPAGTLALGTFNNCAYGYTPWGTYLACEENFDRYFVNGGTIPDEQKRYGINAMGDGRRWHEHDERFDAGRHPNEPNRFGYVVEIDPYDPKSTPVKRTALGRCKHEGAALSIAPSGRLVYYCGDDERFEYIYKFVTTKPWDPNDRKKNSDLLDEGTLYVARFNADGTGTWLPLVQGQSGLTAAAGFATQADVCIKTRQAGDVAGATKMDRPEWLAVQPGTREVYCSLSNNNLRGTMGRPGPDAANPRAVNLFGQIIRWREDGNDPTATSFRWDLFLIAGNPQLTDADKKGNIKGDIFGSPDGLMFDGRGVLWIQTDVSAAYINTGDYVGFGNNQMLAADPKTGEVRRFLTGPRNCEITAAHMLADSRTMLVNIQHPGEPPSERSDSDMVLAISRWPDGVSAGRPRSATVVIRRTDGGIIGS